MNGFRNRMIAASRRWIIMRGIKAAKGFALYSNPIIKAIASHFKYLNMKYNFLYLLILVPSNFYL